MRRVSLVVVPAVSSVSALGCRSGAAPAGLVDRRQDPDCRNPALVGGREEREPEEHAGDHTAPAQPAREAGVERAAGRAVREVVHSRHRVREPLVAWGAKDVEPGLRDSLGGELVHEAGPLPRQHRSAHDAGGYESCGRASCDRPQRHNAVNAHVARLPNLPWAGVQTCAPLPSPTNVNIRRSGRNSSERAARRFVPTPNAQSSSVSNATSSNPLSVNQPRIAGVRSGGRR